MIKFNSVKLLAFCLGLLCLTGGASFIAEDVYTQFSVAVSTIVLAFIAGKSYQNVQLAKTPNSGETKE